MWFPKKVVKHKFFMVRYKKCLPFVEIGLKLLEDYMKSLSSFSSASDNTDIADNSAFNVSESHYVYLNVHGFNGR